jgi:hypothetical protein
MSHAGESYSHAPRVYVLIEHPPGTYHELALIDADARISLEHRGPDPFHGRRGSVTFADLQLAGTVVRRIMTRRPPPDWPPYTPDGITAAPREIEGARVPDPGGD